MASKIKRTQSLNSEATATQSSSYRGDNDDQDADGLAGHTQLTIPRIPWTSGRGAGKAIVGQDASVATMAKQPVRTRADHRKDLDKIQTYGYMPLIESIWADEFAQRAPITDPGTNVRRDVLQNGFKQLAQQTFCSMEQEVIEVLGRGNLAHRFHNAKSGEHVRKYIEGIMEASKTMPCIYVRFFVNNDYLAPTAQHMLEFAEWAHTYAKPCGEWTKQELEAVYKVEKEADELITKDDVKHGERKIVTEDRLKKFAKIKDWAATIKDSMSAIPQSERDEPLPYPPTYTGYAKTVENRWKAHEKSGGTSTFNTLLLTYFLAKYPDDVWSFENIAVALIAEKKQAGVAETSVASLTLSPFRYGGLNDAHCGAMGANLDTFDWSDLRDQVMQMTNLATNYRTEEGRIKKYYQTDDTNPETVRKKEEQIAQVEAKRFGYKQDILGWIKNFEAIQVRIEGLSAAGAPDNELMYDLKLSTKGLQSKVLLWKDTMDEDDRKLLD